MILAIAHALLERGGPSRKQDFLIIINLRQARNTAARLFAKSDETKCAKNIGKITTNKMLCLSDTLDYKTSSSNRQQSQYFVGNFVLNSAFKQTGSVLFYAKHPTTLLIHEAETHVNGCFGWLQTQQKSNQKFANAFFTVTFIAWQFNACIPTKQSSRVFARTCGYPLAHPVSFFGRNEVLKSCCCANRDCFRCQRWLDVQFVFARCQIYW